MSMSDPISDLLTRIRNGQTARKPVVRAPASKMKLAVCKVLEDEGYIDGVSVEGEGATREMLIRLRYFEGRPVIENLRRVSRPGLRIYRAKDDLPRVMGDLGVAIVSTSQGVMSDRQAREGGHGGEVLCVVS